MEDFGFRKVMQEKSNDDLLEILKNLDDYNENAINETKYKLFVDDLVQLIFSVSNVLEPR